MFLLFCILKLDKYFENLDFSHFKNKLIFLDIDGTIVADSKFDVSADVLHKIKELDENNQVFLCTNSFHKDRAKNIANITKLKFIDCHHKKPSKKILNYIPKELLNLGKVVIGDKFLTEGLFAIRIKGEFLKVKRKVNKDVFYIKIINFIDDLVIKFLL